MKKETGKPRKKWLRRGLIALACVLALLVAMVSYGSYLQGEQYAQAVTLTLDGDYDGATELLTGLEDYEDCPAILTYVQCQQKAETCSGAAWAEVNAALDGLKVTLPELQEQVTQLQERAQTEQLAYEQEEAEQAQAAELMAEIDQLADLDYGVSAFQTTQKAIQTVRSDYDQCAETVQARVTNYDALKAAEKQIKKTAQLDQDYQKQAEPIIQGIEALGDITLDSKNQLEQLTAQYQALPEDGRAYVTNYDTLRSGNDSYTKLKKEYDQKQKEAKEAAEQAAAEKVAQKQQSSGGWETSSGNTSNPSASGTVYWTPSGEVYHKRSSCPSLARSKTIYSGTVAESGKSRGCKNCCK